MLFLNVSIINMKGLKFFGFHVHSCVSFKNILENFILNRTGLFVHQYNKIKFLVHKYIFKKINVILIIF